MGRDFIYPQMTQITQIFFGAQHTVPAEKKEVRNGKGFAHSEGYFFTTKTTKNTEKKFKNNVRRILEIIILFAGSVKPSSDINLRDRRETNNGEFQSAKSADNSFGGC